MVAIVSGNSLGLELTSLGTLGTLGSQGMWGLPGQGNSGEQVYVNAATGNLVVQRRDDFLASRGLDNEAVRTYNSLGLLSKDGDNGDAWSLGIYAQQILLKGTVNTAGSELVRTGRDGSQATYTWNGTAYVSTAGAGAHDTITADTANKQYIRTEGTTGTVEKYSSVSGRLLSVADTTGNTSWYTYTDGLLTKVLDKSGETIWYDYGDVNNPRQLTGIRTEAGGQVRNLVRYVYENNRLKSVTVDLTPEVTTDTKVYTTTYTYVGTTNLIDTLTQSDGSSLKFTYDTANRVKSIVQTLTDSTTAETLYTYGSGRTTVTDPMGKVWLYDYVTTEGASKGQLLKLTSPGLSGSSGITQSYTYDADGNVKTITNGDGETVTMEYDSRGNQVKVTDHLGNAILRTYDAVTNQLLSETRTRASAPALVDQGGAALVGSDVVKTGGVDGFWDSSVRSSSGLTGGAQLSFTVGQADKALMVGLSSTPTTNHGPSSITFGIYCTTSKTIEIREAAYDNGSTNKLTSTVTYEPGDRFTVAYTGSKVIYKKNDEEFFSTTVTTSLPLYFDSSFCRSGARISSVSFGTATNTVPLVAESNASVSGSGVVTKNGGTHGVWDASVRGLTGLSDGAMVSFTPGQTDGSLMVGLTTDPAANDNYNTIDYAIYCRSDGRLMCYENGVGI